MLTRTDSGLLRISSICWTAHATSTSMNLNLVSVTRSFLLMTRRQRLTTRATVTLREEITSSKAMAILLILHRYRLILRPPLLSLLPTDPSTEPMFLLLSHPEVFKALLPVLHILNTCRPLARSAKTRATIATMAITPTSSG